MRIIVDPDIPLAVKIFDRVGELIVLPGRQITSKEVKMADALVIRSVTQINKELLAGSPVGFVGTATIGFDHVDVNYLHSQGIQFTSAGGSNANAVAEYVVTALLEISEMVGKNLEGSSIAIVGVGNIGSRLLKKAEALGMRTFLNDPPKYRETGDSKFLPLSDVLRGADYVTLHVPLERKGADPTYHLADRKFFSALKAGAIFLNTSRGDVVDEVELKRSMSERGVSRAVLDVWHGEPVIDPGLAGSAFLATAHIAGYSYEGKLAGTAMIYEALCRWANQQVPVSWSDFFPPPPVPQVDLNGLPGDDEALLRTAVRQVYDIWQDDRALRQSLQSGEKRAVEFDFLRNNYPLRREFSATRIIVPSERSSLAHKALGLGFQVEQQTPESSK